MREFQAILAKDDTDMNEGDEEFMWSKRENLRSFPEALPKVLLSAPEKNYTGMSTILTVAVMYLAYTHPGNRTLVGD